jgi:uncharacterized protein RhaS with RHS repeats
MFSPTLGRWIQNDPIEFEAGDPNLYRFVGNNALNFVDPTGLFPQVVAKSVYSRGNDDPAENNYETARLEVSLMAEWTGDGYDLTLTQLVLFPDRKGQAPDGVIQTRSWYMVEVENSLRKVVSGGVAVAPQVRTRFPAAVSFGYTVDLGHLKDSDGEYPATTSGKLTKLPVALTDNPQPGKGLPATASGKLTMMTEGKTPDKKRFDETSLIQHSIVWVVVAQGSRISGGVSIIGNQIPDKRKPGDMWRLIESTDVPRTELQKPLPQKGSSDDR